MALVTTVLNSDDILAAIHQAKGEIMAKMQEYADQFAAKAAELNAAVQPLAGAIDRLEAAVTAATQNPDVPQNISDQLQAALNDLTSVRDAINAAATDAGDNVDEAAGNPTP